MLHAGGHEWIHLSMFCDIGLVLARHPALRWEIVRRHLADSNTRRIVLVSLCLTQRHWDAPMPPELIAEISGDPEVQGIAAAVENELWPNIAEEGDDAFGSDSRWRWLLRRTRQEKLSDRMRHITGITLNPTLIDYETFNLPHALIPLYPFVRGARLAWKYGRSAVANSARLF